MAKKKNKKYRIKRDVDIDEDEDLEEDEEDQDQEEHSTFRPVTSTLKLIGIIFIVASVFHGVVINRSWNIPVQAMSLIGSGTYTVKQGDTLWLIAKKQYPKENLTTKIREIKEKNHLKGDAVRVGQVLQLP